MPQAQRLDLLRKIWKTNRARGEQSECNLIAANFRPLHCGIASLGETFSVRFIPSGVISKAQAMTSAMGNQRVSTTTAFVRPIREMKRGEQSPRFA